jgi:demethylmenaquinone methyltransferase/2-methoxy-6-polyprenyl-1,4-benzoquinol methylase
MVPDGRPSLRGAFFTPDTKRTYVRRLFSVIAPRYDLITVLLSFGRDREWKRRLAAMCEPVAGTRVIDLASGTGDIAFEMGARGAHVVGLDITHGMLEIAASKPEAARYRVAFVAGDMGSLPFPDACFDIVTTGYGLRNVPHLAGALAEIHRVLRPEGRMLSLDFDRPAQPIVRGVYLAYLTVVGSLLGAVLHGDADTYRYIPESIRRYPGAAAVSALTREAGFRNCTHVRVLAGLMAIHVATK